MSRASEARMIRQKVMQTLQMSQQQMAAQRVSQQVLRARQLHEQQMHLRAATAELYGQAAYAYQGTDGYGTSVSTGNPYVPEESAYYQQTSVSIDETQYSMYPPVNGANGYDGVVPQPPPPPEPDQPREKKNLVPTKHNSQYNMNTLLASNILHSDYFRSLYEKNTFQQVVDEIFYHVDHVEPWMNRGTKKPSTAFCLLYKFFTMKLTVKQMSTLLSHRDSPYIRAIGFLYLRFVCPPDQLWSWFEPFIHDQEEFCPQQGSKKAMTIGKWLESLLASDLKYYGTLLPRIPKQIEVSTQVNLLKTKADVDSNVPSSSGEYMKGMVVRARYSEDGKWYDARIEEPGRKPGTYWVTYLPEDEYGNQEEVELKNIKPIQGGGSKRSLESEEDLIQQVLEKERESVATSGRDYAKPVPGIKSSLAAPLAKRHRTEEDAPIISRTIEEVLEAQGRIGDIESEHKPQKKSKQREELLARYGNVASSSSEMKAKVLKTYHCISIG